MFFYISKILVPFIHPVTYLFLLLLIALCFYRKPRVGKTCIIIALLLLLVFGTYPVPDMMVRYLETKYATHAPLAQSDAVVVLSGMVYLFSSTPDSIEFNEGVERIIAEISLIKKGYAETLIISGGSGDMYNQNKSEALLLKQFSIDFGIPEENILIDPSSRNTYENAVNTKTLMEKHGISSIILVTSASHLPRAMGCFEKLGIHPVPYGVDYQSSPNPRYHLSDIIPDVGALRKTSYSIHEYVGILIYKLTGYI